MRTDQNGPNSDNDSRYKIINCPNEHYGVTLTTVNFAAGVDSGSAVILGNASSGSITVTLPLAADQPGDVFFIKKIDANQAVVNVTASGDDTIDGAATQVLGTRYQVIQVVSDGETTWHIVGGYSP